MIRTLPNLLAAGCLALWGAACFGAVSQDENGWTTITASGDSRIVYVSNSIGNDSYDGLSGTDDGGGVGPKATIAAGLALMRDGYPDHLLLKRGDTWTTTSSMNSSIGRSMTEPHYIGPYGTGARPKIVNVDSQVFRLVSRSYVFIIGIHFDGSTRIEEDTSGPAIEMAGYGVGYHFEDCLMDGTKGGLSLSGFNGVFDDVTIRRNVVVNAWSGTGHCQGMYIDTTHGLLLEENILDHNGWHATLGTGATVYNHSLYITHETRDVTIQNNVISRGASSGLKFQPNDGVHYVTNNLFVKNAIVGTVGGGQPDKVIEGEGAVIYWNNNVAVEPQDNGTGERGGLTSSNLDGGTYHNNIMANTSGSTIQAYWTDGWESQGVGVNNFSMQNNVFYNWQSGIAVTNNASNLTFKNNIIDLPNQPNDRYVMLYRTGGSFAEVSGNQYYSGAAAGVQFEIDDEDATYSEYIAATGETGSSNSQPSYTDGTRSATSFATTNGYDDWPDLIDDLVTQSNGDWDTDIMADAINDWIREGFDVGEETPVGQKKVLILR